VLSYVSSWQEVVRLLRSCVLLDFYPIAMECVATTQNLLQNRSLYQLAIVSNVIVKAEPKNIGPVPNSKMGLIFILIILYIPIKHVLECIKKHTY
jgi:hypothetical protein